MNNQDIETAAVETWAQVGAIRYPENAILVAWDDIEMSGRARADFGNLEELANGILKNGLIHPPLVSKLSGGTKPYRLVGGERRMQAMKLIGLEEFPVNIREEMPEHEVRELELMENLHRKEMRWQEKCVLIARTHRLKVAAASKDMISWGTSETGSLLGVSNAHVSHATQVAEYILKGDDDVLAASSLFAAYEVLLKKKDDLVTAMLSKDLNETAARSVTRMGFITQADDVDSIFDLNDVDVKAKAGIIEQPELSGKLDFNLSALFRLGDCLDVMRSMPDECIDHVVTDPPYGIDLEQMTGLKNIDTVIDTHQVDQNISMFEPFLTEVFRLLKPSGYCAFWYDISHHEKLQALALKIGYKAQRWPVIWRKLHPCLNNAPRYNTTKNMEFAMLLRKSSSSFLCCPQNSSFIDADGSAERKLYDNPFAKPMAVWRYLLEAIAREGQTILDPYAGQASCLRTVINMRMIPMGIEIDVDHFNKGMLNLSKLINEINGKTR